MLVKPLELRAQLIFLYRNQHVTFLLNHYFDPNNDEKVVIILAGVPAPGWGGRAPSKQGRREGHHAVKAFTPQTLFFRSPCFFFIFYLNLWKMLQLY